MIGTSGSEARRMVESGDFRALVEELERLTEEFVDPARLGGKELYMLPSVEGDGVLVEEKLVERYGSIYGSRGARPKGVPFRWKEPGGERSPVEEHLEPDGYIADWED